MQVKTVTISVAAVGGGCYALKLGPVQTNDVLSFEYDRGDLYDTASQLDGVLSERVLNAMNVWDD